MSVKSCQGHYVPLSAIESWQLINQLTQNGLGTDEAIGQVAMVNYIARREHLAARNVVESTLNARQSLK